MQKLPISVVLIAKNEEHNLKRCLASVADWVSEIVAVVNDCTDKTEEILKQYGARVYEHEWLGYVKQKNIALSYAKEKWILSIDADEEIPPATRLEIKKWIESQEGKVAGVNFRRKTFFLGRWIKHGDWYPDRVTRLFLRGRASFEGNYLHEKLVVEGVVAKSQCNFLHYSFPTIYTFLRKTDSFTRSFVIANEAKLKLSKFGTLFRSVWKFFRGYVFNFGFLDGYPGLFIAVQQSYSTFFRYSALYEKQLSKSPLTLDPEDTAQDL